MKPPDNGASHVTLPCLEPDLMLSYVLLGPVKGGRGFWADAQSLLVSTALLCGTGARREEK